MTVHVCPDKVLQHLELAGTGCHDDVGVAAGGNCRVDCLGTLTGCRLAKRILGGVGDDLHDDASAIIAGGPNPDNAKLFLDYANSKEAHELIV